MPKEKIENLIKMKRIKKGVSCERGAKKSMLINQINGFGKSFKSMTIDTVKGFLTDSKKSRFSL